MIVDIRLQLLIIRQVDKYERGSLAREGLLHLYMNELNASEAGHVPHFLVEHLAVLVTLVEVVSHLLDVIGLQLHLLQIFKAVNLFRGALRADRAEHVRGLSFINLYVVLLNIILHKSLLFLCASVV